ncbi:MAG: aldose epimerase family protein [Pseudomonadota bacterium]
MTSIDERPFGIWQDKQPVDSYILRNRHGMSATVIPVGASLQSLCVPDRQGHIKDIVLGFDQPSDYAVNHPYLGCTVGRFANRIADARFELDGRSFALTTNAGSDHLHGGDIGISRRLWGAVMERDAQSGVHSVSFYLDSPDGEDGYPGNLSLRVRYSLDDNRCLAIEYFARSDKKTVINLTNHSYFNLNGHASGAIGDHVLRVFASRYTPTDDNLLPTGSIDDVEDPIDFRKPRPIGDELGNPMLAHTGGYDHNYVLDKNDQRMALAAVLLSPTSGIRMAVTTSEPAMQLYTANSLALDNGKTGTGYLRHEAVCLETQGFPDAPNQPHFPDATLEADSLFYSKTIYRFDTVGDTDA